MEGYVLGYQCEGYWSSVHVLVSAQYIYTYISLYQAIYTYINLYTYI